MKPFFPLLGCAFFAFSCTDDTGRMGVPKPAAGAVYADYQVWAEEESGQVTIRLQLRQGNAEGPAFALPTPGQISLDGETLAADSTPLNGVYYETAKQVTDFAGEHTIAVQHPKGNQHEEQFTFRPFTLARELPAGIKKKPFAILLQGIEEDTGPLRLVMIDTDYESADVNEEVWPQKGQLNITKEHLANLTKGPVVLEIYQEVEKAIEGSRRYTGKLSLTYGLKREFQLVE